MSKKKNEQSPEVFPLPVAAMLLLGIVGGLICGASFVVIQYWPLPPSVAPALDFNQGFGWGAVVGGVMGLILGYLTDDAHFDNSAAV